MIRRLEWLRTPDEADLATLAEVHAALSGKPYFDGVYLTGKALAEQPSDERIAPFTMDGEFHTGESCFELNPVLWLTLCRHGLPVRGPAVADLGLSPDPAALRHWNLNNLKVYWQPLAARARAKAATLPADAPVDPVIVTWIALGPARLHYTLAFEDVISKARAGAYLSDIFPAYAPLADRALRWRSGEPVGFVAADLTAAAAMIDDVVADSWRRWG